jgi:eukaryotic-like serine/threonine-protein kinase
MRRTSGRRVDRAPLLFREAPLGLSPITVIERHVPAGNRAMTFIPADCGNRVLALQTQGRGRRVISRNSNWEVPMNSIASAGSVLGSRYVLDHLLAVGGMGQVWKATDQVLERAVAVKLLRTDLIDSEDFRRRFQAEARLAAGLSHPGIAHVYDYSEEVADDQRLAFLVMELVDGQPLSDRLARRDRPTIAETMSILDQTGRALGAAHELGIVHRDVKPGNLLVTPDGRVKVTDFGIARAINSADITEVGQVIGTVRYMSPEQARGEEATPASDVYSLAIVGYEMLSGHTPFAGDSPVAIALAQVQTTPEPLPPSVPAELRSLITQSLAKLSAQRPGDGAAFASALQRITLEPTPTTIRSTTSIDPAPPSQPNRSTDVQATAVFQHPTTSIDPPSSAGGAAAETTAPAPALSNEPLLAEGWVRQQRRRRRVAAWSAAFAVAVCLLLLMAVSGGADRNPETVASGTTVTTPAPPAPRAATATVVTIDPAAYFGRTEADARAALAAAGLTALTTTGPSSADLAGLVIDVQPNGPVAPGSNITITLGDGTIAAVTDPPANDPGTGQGNGNGKDRGKGNGKGKGKIHD